MVPPLLPPAII